MRPCIPTRRPCSRGQGSWRRINWERGPGGIADQTKEPFSVVVGVEEETACYCGIVGIITAPGASPLPPLTTVRFRKR